MADPRCVELIEVLEDRGFFFGTVRPGNVGSDVRSQRLTRATVAPTAIMTISSGGRLLLDWITREHAMSRSE